MSECIRANGLGAPAAKQIDTQAGALPLLAIFEKGRGLAQNEIFL